jgi:YD repeat-containing protein
VAEPPPEEAQGSLEHGAALETPKAEAEREASEYAYTNLAPGQEERLLEEEFAPQLEAIDADPSRVLSEVALDELTSSTEALVTLEGERVLVESATPLRAPDADGQLSKVDLGLEESSGGYSPANPLVEVRLPASAAEPIGIGESGLAITAQGANPNSTARLLDEEDLFLPGAKEDTSLLLSPISGGLELSAMLASRNSPEQLAFAVAVPQGTELRASGEGGAEVIGADDDALYRITAPRAIDAQGTSIPGTLDVSGDSIIISVAHREMDVSYPLYLDPEVIEESQSGFADPSKLNYWTWQFGGAGGSEFIGQRSPIVDNWGNGLYIRSRANTTYGAGSFGRWWFTPPGSTTYFRRAIFGPIHFDAHGCAANEPHGYAGIWNNGNFWSVRVTANPSAWANGFDVGNLPAGSQTAFLGIEAAGNTNIKCGRDYALNGATFYMDDPENPTVGVPSGVPTKWVNSGTAFTISVPASDPGLGVKSGRLSPAGFAEHSQELACSGLVAKPCPPSHTFGFLVSGASFSEGETSARISAKDALEKVSNTQEVTLKVDNTPPELKLDGQLAKATDEVGGKKAEEEDSTKFDALSLPVYNLEINATDGSNESATARRSGVKSVEVFLDKGVVPIKTWSGPSCPASSCPLSGIYTLKLNELSAETHHTLRVVAKDFAENKPREREIGFEYIPATGMKEEYVLQHFPLPDGEGNEVEEGSLVPELAVNVVNGNLVFRQQDINLEGPAANLEVERYYNSLLPSSQDTEWGDGWTLAQTPTLETNEPKAPGPPTEATVVEESGALARSVPLPTAMGGTRFDNRLQAVIAREPDGGYAVTDESGEGEGTLDFSQSGKTTEFEATESASVQYSYASDHLAEIAVDEPANASGVAPSQPPESSVDPTPIYSSSFGTSGTGNGQFSHPADVAIDAKGNLWVVDENNNRLQQFNPAGGFIKSLGSAGSGSGQFNQPKSIAFAANGDFWVADSGGSRLEQFNGKGEFLKAVGAFGAGNGQFNGPEGIAIDAKGNIWVADTYNYRIQELNDRGEFLKVVNPSGLGAIEPTGLDVDPAGNVWVADWAHNRVVEFSESGGLLRSFGSEGTGNGQFNRPDAVVVDRSGEVWIGDQNNGRIQKFDQNGDYVTQFGSPGSGNGQFSFSYPLGIAAGANGELWIADTNNNRIQKWLTPPSDIEKWEAEVAAEVQAPSLDVNVASGLVQSVAGDEAGEVTYQHTGDLLTEVDGSEGATSYEYDGTGRMTKVTLPNGTFAEVGYEPAFGRVSSVTVSIEGAKATATRFEYTNEPRRTKVVPDGEAAATYDIGADGSVFKWANGQQPPTFDSIAGTLHDPEDLETVNPISAGAHNLVVQAHASEGIASIQVIAGNDQLVADTECEKPRSECETESLQWVTETADWAPGIVYLEVVATDQIGQTASERFWVNIPYTPPPEAETPQPSRFTEIFEFRKEFGLDLDLKGNEAAIDARIFDLMGDWNNPHTPAGEVARASWERWGVPLRLVDVGELEYRDWFYHVNADRIEQWVKDTEPSSFAGYYLDHATGGIMYVGFLDHQAERLADLKASLSLLGGERLRVYQVTPTASYLSVQAASQSVSNAIESNSTLAELVVDVKEDEAGEAVRVGTENVAQVEGLLNQMLGSNVPVAVEYEGGDGEPLSGRFRNKGRMRAGDFITSPIFTEGGGHPGNSDCTAGFGAKDKVGERRGRPIWSFFLLTAGHCTALVRFPTVVYRSTDSDSHDESHWKKVGTTRRQGLGWIEPVHTDAQAIEVQSDGIVPQAIFGSGGSPLPVKPASTARKGDFVCFSGAKSQSPNPCGKIVARSKRWVGGDGRVRAGYWVKFNRHAVHGDSGAPVWNISGASIGLVTAGRPEGALTETLVEPLLHPPHMPTTVPGILKNPHLRPLSLKLGGRRLGH